MKNSDKGVLCVALSFLLLGSIYLLGGFLFGCGMCYLFCRGLRNEK